MQARLYRTQSVDGNKDRGLWHHNEPIHGHSQKKRQQNQDQDDEPEMKWSVSFRPPFYIVRIEWPGLDSNARPIHLIPPPAQPQRHVRCREQPSRGAPWVSGLFGHFVQTWPDSECSHTVQFLDSAVLGLWNRDIFFSSGLCDIIIIII